MVEAKAATWIEVEETVEMVATGTEEEQRQQALSLVVPTSLQSYSSSDREPNGQAARSLR